MFSKIVFFIGIALVAMPALAYNVNHETLANYCKSNKFIFKHTVTPQALLCEKTFGNVTVTLSGMPPIESNGNFGAFNIICKTCSAKTVSESHRSVCLSEFKKAFRANFAVEFPKKALPELKVPHLELKPMELDRSLHPLQFLPVSIEDCDGKGVNYQISVTGISATP